MTTRLVSNSEIQTFKHCRRKWYLSDYLELGVNDQGVLPVGPMHLGIVIHEALEAKYGHDEDPLTVIDEIYAYRRQPWLWDPTAASAIDSDHELARLMVAGYLEWVESEGIDAEIEVIGTEQTVKAPSRHEGVELVGKLDVRVRDRRTGFRRFIDHKTVGDLTSPLRTIEISEQFPTYGLLERLHTSTEGAEHPDGGYINMLRRVKRTVRANPPFYARHDVKFNKHQLNSMWRRINAVIGAMLTIRAQLDVGADHRDVVYPTPSGDCSWSCPFLKVCTLMDDGSRWEEAVEAEYVRVDPYARYSSPSLRATARQALAEAATRMNEGESVA